jgi:hypothetical protein
MKYNTLDFWVEDQSLDQAPQDQSLDQAPQDQSLDQAPQDQVSTDELTPDMPSEEDDNALENFESWKLGYFKDSVSMGTSDLIESINKIRDENLDSYQRKFIEDNLQILFLKQNANIEKANKELRKLIREELDENTPGVSVATHLESIFKKYFELCNILIKIKGTLGMKSDLHRKFLASLLGCVQVGNGSDNEDIIYNDTNYSIKISTRFNEKFGRIDLGNWYLKSSDPESFLDEAELKRMQEGSPEERDILKKRVIIDSISDYYKERSYLINVVSSDGTVYLMGIDIGSCLSTSYNEGKLVVKFTNSNTNECSIDSEGNINSYLNIKISCLADTGNLDENGLPKKEELSFIERINGNLFLTADLDTIKKVLGEMTGINLKIFPYNGNPSDILKIQRCVPNASEILMRSC